jgi:polysaccharide biosynthesis/export protein
MLKLKLIFLSLFVIISIQGCDKILEPVLLNGKQTSDLENLQEEFDINMNVLTFEKAKDANNAPYQRQLMLTGSGSRAKVLNEADFLRFEIPNYLTNPEYQLGFGDVISFTLSNEFKNLPIKIPNATKSLDYVLGVGDELTFLHFLKTKSPIINKDTNTSKNSILETKGTVGSNGDILLLGVGKILALNRTLDDLRMEVRNVLIRDGLSPNFQLEISRFNSKKVYVTKQTSGGSGYANAGIENSQTISNIPISLQQVALSQGLSKAFVNKALINLIRDKEIFRFTASQLFDVNLPYITLQDSDQVDIQLFNADTNSIAKVDANGNILLPTVGKLKAINRTLSNLEKEIHDILIQNGVIPVFQLDIQAFNSRKVYFVNKSTTSEVIFLTNTQTSLKDILVDTRSLGGSLDRLSIVTLKRGKSSYRLPLDKVLDLNTPEIWIRGDDQIEIEHIAYKPGQVYALSGAGKALILPISPSKRETLADILFTPEGAFRNLNAKRSEVYLLRGRSPATAYHLDAQNVSRILVAANTELRPNDIIYIAERPIISFTRVLAELTPLRILLRDIDDGKIP